MRSDLDASPGRVAGSVEDLAQWYHDNCPDTSAATFEAHLMLLRASVLLLESSPLDAATGLSRARYNILRMLYQAPDGRLLVGEFAEGMNVSYPNISKLVDSLEAEGYVRREGHEEDKRRRWTVLTDKGREVVELSIPMIGEAVGEVWCCLSDDEKRLLSRMLSKIGINAAARAAEKTLIELRRRSESKP